MPDTPMPATWPALEVGPDVVDKLRALWRLLTTDDQRHELERLGEAVECDLAAALQGEPW